MQTLHIIYALIGGYLLGSIPFGLLITKATGQGDIRQIGSGNIGATNVLRTGRKDLALITVLLDGAKAGVAAVIFNHYFGWPVGLFAGAAALIGHCYPVWLKFKGGKGLATFFGILFATAWPIALCTGATWLLIAFTTKMSSLAGLIAAVATPLIALAFGQVEIAVMATALAIIIIIRHAENIGRIRAGTESKIGQKGKKIKEPPTQEASETE